jgi:Uma2 family endonuclease
MSIQEATYEQVALEDPSGGWELACGRLRAKPGVTVGHSDVITAIARLLFRQLDGRDFKISVNLARLRIASGTFYIPGICVIPQAAAARQRRERADRLEVYDEPMPLVVEVWSPSTGEYDVEEKLREYQRRGDLEIWRLRPYERTLTAWRRQADQSYIETLHRGGSVQPVALPGVAIELERLFD